MILALSFFASITIQKMESRAATNMGLEGMEKLGTFIYTLAGLCVFGSVITSFYTVFTHLRNYRKPDLQRLSIRILIMVPVYGVSSFISLSSKNFAFYVDTLRDIYEGFVIYSFFALLITYLDGESAIMELLQHRLRAQYLWPLNYCFKPMQVFNFNTDGKSKYFSTGETRCIAICNFQTNIWCYYYDSERV